MSKITPRKYAVSLYETIGNVTPDQASVLIHNFIAVLKRNNDIAKAEKIIQALQRYGNEQSGVVEVTVVTAEPLESPTRILIIKQLRKSFGRDITLREATEAGLLGGVIFKCGDAVVDGSIRRRLASLAEQIA